jgi:hypothetical protein
MTGMNFGQNVPEEGGENVSAHDTRAAGEVGNQPTQLGDHADEGNTQSINAWSLADDEDDAEVITWRSWKLPTAVAAAALVAVGGASAYMAWHEPAQRAEQHSPPSPAASPPAAPAVAPTRDPDTRANTDPRFLYGVAAAYDSRFLYGVTPGGPCGDAPQQFGYTVDGGAVATCLAQRGTTHGTWVEVSSWGSFDGIHTQGSLCDRGGRIDGVGRWAPVTSMSTDGKQMVCPATGTWEYGSTL